MKPDQGVPDPASRSWGDARRVARPQRFFPFWTMDTDPTGEEAPEDRPPWAPSPRGASSPGGPVTPR